MLEIADLDLEMLVMALSDQGGGYGTMWTIDPATGEIAFIGEDFGVDDLDETDLIKIEPLSSREWYLDMEDFAEGIDDEQASRRLGRAIQGRGAFRRFKDELHDEYPHLLTLWHEFSNRRGIQRAVEWLADNSLVDRGAAELFLAEHPDIGLGDAQPPVLPTSTSAPQKTAVASHPSDAELDSLIAKVTIDAHSGDEQLTAFQIAFEEHLALPFMTEVLGMLVTVERIDLSGDGRIVAVCEREGTQQPIGVLDLPLPDPPPSGAQWIAAYGRWMRR